MRRQPRIACAVSWVPLSIRYSPVITTARLGDKMADIAASNGWEGIVVNGAIRDAVALADIDLGVKALGTNPRKSHKHGAGQQDIPVAFGGVVFTPGATLVSDENGVVVLP